MSLISLQRWLILALVAITPIFTVAELLEVARGGAINQSEALTPIYVKAMKDGIMAILIAFGIVVVRRYGRIFANPYILLLLFAGAAAAIVSYYFLPLILFLAGARALLPIVLILFIWRAVDTRLQLQIAQVLRALFLLALALQIYQLLYFPPFWGTNALGLSARNPGFFIIPSTMGAFACATCYYVYCYLPRHFINTGIVFMACPLSVLLTQSASSVLSFLALMSAWAFFRVRERVVIVVLFVAVIASAAAVLPDLVARKDVYKSLQERGEILQRAAAMSPLVGSPFFGVGTNTGVALAHTLDGVDLDKEDTIIADSTVIAFMINVGMIAFPLFLLAWLSVFSYTLEYAMFMAIILVFSMTTVIVESFPLNLLMAVNFVYLTYLRRSSQIIAEADRVAAAPAR